MRTLTPATNLVLSCLAALALLTTLEFPWVSPAVSDPVTTDGPVERAAFQVAHVFQSPADATAGAPAPPGDQYVLPAGGGAVVLLGRPAAPPPPPGGPPRPPAGGGGPRGAGGRPGRPPRRCARRCAPRCGRRRSSCRSRWPTSSSRGLATRARASSGDRCSAWWLPPSPATPRG